MLIVGLTGGIGSGKSTVSALLAERGAVVIDADAIVHELQRPGQPVFEAMVDAFGPEIVAADGSLDRERVAALVFGDSDSHRERLARLNAIVHPAVGEEIGRRLAAEAEGDNVVILDVPLMVESGRGGYAGLLVIDCPVETAVQRLVEHRGLDEGDARARIARQASREERLAEADFVVDNSRSRDQLAGAVAAAWAWIESLRAARPA